jgi:hypothetical protein
MIEQSRAADKRGSRYCVFAYRQELEEIDRAIWVQDRAATHHLE